MRALLDATHHCDRERCHAAAEDFACLGALQLREFMLDDVKGGITQSAVVMRWAAWVFRHRFQQIVHLVEHEERVLEDGRGYGAVKVFVLSKVLKDRVPTRFVVKFHLDPLLLPIREWLSASGGGFGSYLHLADVPADT